MPDSGGSSNDEQWVPLAWSDNAPTERPSATRQRHIFKDETGWGLAESICALIWLILAIIALILSFATVLSSPQAASQGVWTVILAIINWPFSPLMKYVGWPFGVLLLIVFTVKHAVSSVEK